MDQEKNITELRDFTRKFLPWVLGFAALLVYTFTICRWVTLSSLKPLAQIAEWDWQLISQGPVWYIVSYPIKWVSPFWQPMALNYLSAVMAAMVIGLLARIVTLLPQDRTRDHRMRMGNEHALIAGRMAWIPPVLACTVLGLHQVFWEHAVTGTGEMLDVLMLAYVVRCLLEYRISQKDFWLVRMALVYGLAMTNNFAMWGFFPIVLTVLIMLKQREFFRMDFLLKMMVALGTGLLFYTLLPLVALVNPAGNPGIWDTLLMNVKYQKNMLMSSGLRFPFFIMSISSVIPLMLVIIRWPTWTGDINPVGTYLHNFLFRTIHAALFVVCLWAMTNPPYRQYISVMPVKFMTLFFICALCVGYLSGYIIVVFGMRGSIYLPKYTWAERFATVAIFVASLTMVVVMPVVMVILNLPKIRELNNPALKTFTRLMAEYLPEKPALVLSDDLIRIYLLRAYWAQENQVEKHALLHSGSLSYHSYHDFLMRAYPGKWAPLPHGPNGSVMVEPIPGVPLAEHLLVASKKWDIYYLHPSFGYYFEVFDQRSLGMVQKLVKYPEDSLLPPALTEQEIKLNYDFWKKVTPEITHLRGLIEHGSTEARLLSMYYSRALNCWGVRLQLNNRPKEAEPFFKNAVAANEDNVVAHVNVGFNRQLLAGKVTPAPLLHAVETKFGEYRSWDAVLGANGPFDDPAYAFYLGRIFSRNRLFRQSSQQFERLKSLDKSRYDVDLMLADVAVQTGDPARALRITRDLHGASIPALSNSVAQAEIMRIQALAHLAMRQPEKAYEVLKTTINIWPKDPPVLDIVVSIYQSQGMFAEALNWVNQLLDLLPDDVGVMQRKAEILFQLKNSEQALEVLKKILRRDPENVNALSARANHYLQINEFDLARADYARMLRVFPKAAMLNFSLGEVAYRQKNFPQAIKYYKDFLKYAPSAMPERELVNARMKEMKAD